MKEKVIPAFLTGGGHMGELIRSFDWSKTAVGSPDTWPQPLCIAVRIMLDCPFGMYIAWGSDYIQLYNDGYRPILGTTKHPQALGISTRKTFEEIWQTIGPMFDGVMEGTPVGFPDFKLQLDRNGFLEECVFDFSYSPIRLENGEVGGVLVTVIETTEKVKAVNALKETEKRFQNLIREVNVGIVVLTGEEMRVEVVNEAYGRLIELKPDDLLGKPLFDLIPHAKDFFLPLLNKVRLTGEPLYLYDQPYSVVVNGKKIEGYLNVIYQAYKEADGTISGVIAICQDITETLKNRKKLEKSERRLHDFIMQAPAMLALLKGAQHRFELISPSYTQFIGNREVIGKTLIEAIPELKGQGFIELLDQVYKTGETFVGKAMPCMVDRGNGLALSYLNLTYQAFRNEDEKAEGILVFAYDVTEQVEAQKIIEANEQRISNERMVFYNSFMNAPAGIAILKGATHMYEFANAEYEKLVDRKITPGKTVKELFPEIEHQGLLEILNNVFTTGEPFIANEFPVELIDRNTNKPVLRYYNSVLQPIKNEKGITERLLSHGVEVTEQVKARKQIEEANQQLRLAATLTENIADAVIGTDMDHKIISWNKGAENLYGYTSEEVIGKHGKEVLRTQFLSEEDRLSWPVALDTIGKWQGEVLQSKKDGTVVSILVSIAYVYDENGKPIAGVGVTRDITERKKAEEKIKESENQFRTFADSIQNLAWVANGEGWIYWYNRRWLDYTGLTLEEMQGWGWQKVHHPDHLKGVMEFTKEAWKKDEAFELTFPLRRYDGEYRWFLTRAYPIKDATGNVERWIGTNTDITEQKMSEQKKDQFLAIASHEMKTPLSIAKAYLELLLEHLKDEDKVANIFGQKAHDAMDRLNVLIGELLDVTKIQHGKLNYQFTPVNLNTLINDTVADMQHSISTHLIIKKGDTNAMVKGDKDRLQQVIINLLSNAAKYSPQAKNIYITIEEKNEELKVGIKDEGIGINTHHFKKIFDRYYRVEEHAVKFQGLGIGLFISNEIIIRHNGKMWVESEPGKGSIFYFTIPVLTHTKGSS